MAGLLLKRIIATAQVLALDLQDQALLDRLDELQNRAQMESTEDIYQLLNELGTISDALQMNQDLPDGKNWIAFSTPGVQHVGCLKIADPYV